VSLLKLDSLASGAPLKFVVNVHDVEVAASGRGAPHGLGGAVSGLSGFSHACACRGARQARAHRGARAEPLDPDEPDLAELIERAAPIR
jgi:hypothetical protein